MGETVSQIPPKGYKNLQGSDFVKGLSYILFGIITGMILFALSQDHWPTWPQWRPVVYTSATTLFGYIGKNYWTNNEGKMFKHDVSTTTVGTSELKEVVEQAKEVKDAKP